MLRNKTIKKKKKISSVISTLDISYNTMPILCFYLFLAFFQKSKVTVTLKLQTLLFCYLRELKWGSVSFTVTKAEYIYRFTVRKRCKAVICWKAVATPEKGQAVRRRRRPASFRWNSYSVTVHDDPLYVSTGKLHLQFSNSRLPVVCLQP